MSLLDGGGCRLAALNRGAFESAAAIPSWETVMAEWHELARTAHAVAG
jgi:hypothetical protein